MSELPSDAPPLSNRLTIAHLLLWTATTALVIGAIMPEPVEMSELESDVSAAFRARLIREQRYSRLATVISGPVLGAGLAALAISSWRYCRGLPGFPSQPGHWILMIIGFSALAFMALRTADHVARAEGSGLPPQPLSDVIAVVCAGFLMLAIGLVFAAYLHISEPLRWKRVFAIAGANVAFFFCGGCLMPIPFVFPYLTLAVSLVLAYVTPASILVAAIVDVRSGQSFDVFHWVGAASIPALAVILTALLLLP